MNHLCTCNACRAVIVEVVQDVMAEDYDDESVGEDTEDTIVLTDEDSEQEDPLEASQ